MGNTQKGFVVPLLIIIAVLVIGGGIYYCSKTFQGSQSQSVSESSSDIQVTSNPPVVSPISQNAAQKKLTIPSGLFTIGYPDNLVVKQTTTTVSLMQNDDTQGNNVISIATVKGTVADYEAFLEAFAKKSIIKKESVGVGNMSVDRYELSAAKEPLAKAVTYIIPVTYNMLSGVIVVTVASKEGSTEWLSEAETIVKSIGIDSSKVTTITQ